MPQPPRQQTPRPAPRRVPPPPPLPPWRALLSLDDENLWRHVLLPRIVRGEDDAWRNEFTDVDLADRVLRVLTEHAEDVRDGLAQYNARLAAGEIEPDEEWRVRAVTFLRSLNRRRRQMQLPAKQARQAAAAERSETDEAAARRALAKLTEAVAQHEVDSPVEGDDADGRLWAALDEITVPAAGGERTLRQMLDAGVWGRRRQ